MRRLLLACLLGLAATAAFSADKAVQCVVVALRGKVNILRSGEKKAIAAKKGDFVYEGDTITTGSDSLAAIALTGGAEVRINAETTFKLSGQSANGAQKTEMKEGQ